jgi:hypothetical protein
MGRIETVLADGFEGIAAQISAPVANIHPGKPVPVRFTLVNENDHPVVLSTPETESKPPLAVAGLPIEHVFSGVGFGGLTIRGDYDRVWTEAFGYSPATESPELILGPHAPRSTLRNTTRHCSRRVATAWCGNRMAGCSRRMN